MTNPKHHGPHCAGLCEGQAYNSRIKNLERENERLRAALQDIAEPIAAMRRDLEEGYRLDGGMANVIASDPMHYRMAARAALAEAKALEGGLGAEVNEAMNTIDNMTADEAKKLLAEITARFRIGEKARTASTIMVNIDNSIRRSECLSRIEAHHKEVVTDEDGEEYEESLLKWGESPDRYIETYKTALSAQGLGTWLEWYWLECDMGKNPLRAAIGGAPLREVATVEDLIKLFEKDGEQP